MNTNSCVAFIFARGGSKGLPRKNVKLLGDLPLIAHSIKTALSCPSIDRVIVSTDDNEIANVATQYGAEVPFIRPDYLAADTSSELDAWKHAIDFMKSNGETFKVFVSLPPTSPLRSVADVEACIDLYMQGGSDIVVTVKQASRSPFFNMLYLNESGYSELVCRKKGDARYTRRQDAPQVFDMTTVAYVSGPDFVLNTESILEGRVRQIVIPEERAVDIDTITDFKFAEFLLERNLNENS